MGANRGKERTIFSSLYPSAFVASEIASAESTKPASTRLPSSAASRFAASEPASMDPWHSQMPDARASPCPGQFRGGFDPKAVKERLGRPRSLGATAESFAQ